MSHVTTRSSIARRGFAFAAVGAIALLSACSSAGGGGSTDPTDIAAGDPQDPEITEVRAGAINGPGAFPLQYAGDAVASDFGLTVEPVWIDNSALAVTAVISGDMDVSNTSYFGLIEAINQGLDLVVIAEGWASAPDTTSIEALPSSGITSLADLEGKTVSVNSLTSSWAIKARVAMIEEGLDPDAVDWVELPLGEIAAALEQGTVDASGTVGASRTAAKSMGSVTVLDLGAGDFDGIGDTGWVVTRQFANENPNTVAALQCTLQTAQTAVNDDRDLYNQLFVERLGAPMEAAEADTPPVWAGENRLDKIQQNADLYHASGLLEEEFDLTQYVLPMPESC